MLLYLSVRLAAMDIIRAWTGGGASFLICGRDGALLASMKSRISRTASEHCPYLVRANVRHPNKAITTKQSSGNTKEARVLERIMEPN